MKRAVCLHWAAWCAALLVLSLATAGPAWALRKGADWGRTTKVGPDAEVPGFYINLGVTGVRAMIAETEPKALLVMFVFKDAPASGKLQAGDKIVGANGRPFVTAHKFGYGVNIFGYEGPMMDLGNALEESQGQRDGKLFLDVLRGDQKLKVELQLTTRYGSFSATYPFDCKKTDVVLQETCAYLLKQQKADGTWNGRPHINAFAALALLGSGKEEYLPAVKKAMQAMARGTEAKIRFGGLPCWKYGLYGAALGEYYLMTGEPWVLPELEKINQWLTKAQAPNGGWGHGPYLQDGSNGYGAINVITMQAAMAWGLMERCGIEVDAKRLADTHDFVARGTNKFGYVWYKDRGAGGMGYADMGRTGASALAHYLIPDGGDAYRDVALLNARCIGDHPTTFPDTHGCPLLGMVWTALGSSGRSAQLPQIDGLQPLVVQPSPLPGRQLLLPAQPGQQSPGFHGRAAFVGHGGDGPDPFGQVSEVADDRRQADHAEAAWRRK